MVAEPCEVGPVAWNTWSEQPVSRTSTVSSRLSDDAVQMSRADSPLGAADLMRQLVYLPQASIVVAESQRVVVGGAILALRPSVRAGGYVGTIDLLVVDPEHDADRITEALLEELLRSASNKGCTVVEAERPDDAAGLRALAADGLRRSRSAHPSNRGRGGIRRASHPMNIPAELRSRAGRANPSPKESS